MGVLPANGIRQGGLVSVSMSFQFGASNLARPGLARPGLARPGSARPGSARPGLARFIIMLQL